MSVIPTYNVRINYDNFESGLEKYSQEWYDAHANGSRDMKIEICERMRGVDAEEFTFSFGAGNYYFLASGIDDLNVAESLDRDVQAIIARTGGRVV